MKYFLICLFLFPCSTVFAQWDSGKRPVADVPFLRSGTTVALRNSGDTVTGFNWSGNLVNSGNFYIGSSTNNSYRLDTGQGPVWNSTANSRINIDSNNGDVDGSRSVAFAQNDALLNGLVFANFLDSGDTYFTKGLTLGTNAWITFNDAATRLVVIGTDTMAYAGIQPNSFSAPRDAMWVNTTGDTLFFKINGSTFHVLLVAGGGH